MNIHRYSLVIYLYLSFIILLYIIYVYMFSIIICFYLFDLSYISVYILNTWYWFIIFILFIMF